MITKQIHIDSKSQFGCHVAANEPEKEVVAAEVVRSILLKDQVNPANPIMIGDGSSASLVFCHYMQKWVETCDDELRVWSNNVDVALQAILFKGGKHNVSIHSAPGRFNFKYCANFGRETEEWCKEHASRCTCVMATTALDYDLGPCGKDEDARSIKAAMMKAANVLIIVADSSKLRMAANPATAASPDEWKVWREERSAAGRLFVVTTRSRHIDPSSPNGSLRGEDASEQRNLRLLNIKLTPTHLKCLPPLPSPTSQ